MQLSSNTKHNYEIVNSATDLTQKPRKRDRREGRKSLMKEEENNVDFKMYLFFLGQLTTGNIGHCNINAKMSRVDRL